MPKPLEQGDPAPPFRLPLADGGTVSLSEFRGRKLVLFFYPKADTSGCTLEAKAFSRLKSEFDKAGSAVLGISADPPRRQAAFQAKHGLSIPLASDESLDVLNAYGVWVKKSMYGRSFMGIARTTFLIDGRGRIARVWDKVKVTGHAEDVLQAAVALGREQS